jgi:hypothetical protein
MMMMEKMIINLMINKVKVFIQNIEVITKYLIVYFYALFLVNLAGGGGIHRPLNQPPKQQRPGDVYRAKV